MRVCKGVTHFLDCFSFMFLSIKMLPFAKRNLTTFASAAAVAAASDVAAAADILASVNATSVILQVDDT